MRTGDRTKGMAIAAAAMAVCLGIAAGGEQPQASGLILGQVVDAGSGQDVPGVVVSLGSPGAGVASAELIEMGPVRGPVGARRVLTAADGRFLFRDLPRGRYELAVVAPGYVPGSYGQNRPSGPGRLIDLGDGEKLGAVSVRIWKVASISGTVLDESGEPAVGVSVRSFRRVIAGGQPRFLSGALDNTDDRGMYRIPALVPGDYVVGVLVRQETAPMAVVSAFIEAAENTPRNSSDAYRTMSASAAPLFLNATGFRVGDFVVRQNGGTVQRPAPSSDGRAMVYQTQFAPDSTTASRASLVSLKSGEDREGVDLRLRLVPGVRVSGKVTGPDGPGAFLGITLVPPAGSDLTSEGMAEAASAITDATGAFTFVGVAPGQYLLKIRMYPRPPTTSPAAVDEVPAPAGRGGPPPPPPATPSLWALMPISVGDSDLTNLGVVLKHGLRVSGRIEFSGTRPAPSVDQIQRLAITLQSAEGRTSAPIASPGRATPDGAFRTAGYAGGRYVVSVSTLPAGWAVKSIMWNGRDVSVEPLELTDADVEGVIITFTDRTTQLAGTVIGTDGPDSDAEVVVFPADSVAWKEIGVVARRARNERTTKGGGYAISGLPPGDYFVIALPGNAIGEPRDPKYLETLIGAATRVTLGDGEKKTTDLRVVRR